MAVAPSLQSGGEVVDVEIATPRQAGAGTKPGHRHSRLSVGTKRADQSVPAGTQHLIDVLDKRLRIAIRGAELAHRRVRELCLANVELTYRGDLRGHFAEA